MTQARVALLCAAVLLIVGCGSQHQQPSPHSSRSSLESIFEDESLLHADPGGALDVLRHLGVDRVRVYLSWASIAPDAQAPARPAHFDPSDPAAYPAQSLTVFDTIVREAAKRHMGLDFTVGGGAPRWATGRGAPAGAPPGAWKPSASQFGAFVHAIGTRYDGSYKPPGSSTPLPRVDFWSIWNEPNYGPDLAPQAPAPAKAEVAPALYRRLLGAAWSALQATGHGHDTILIGEVAPRGQTLGGLPGDFGGMVPLRFVRALYCVDSSLHQLRGTAALQRGCPATQAQSQQFRSQNPALFQASGFSDHPYPLGGLPPNMRVPDEPDYADLAALPNLEYTLDKAQAAYGADTHFPIYSTEFGYQTNPPETIQRTTAPRIAAYYLNWSEYISWRDPRIRSYDQYLLRDPPGANASGGFATGLQFKNGIPKAMFDAYRTPLYLPLTSGRRGHALEVWGCVRPAPFAGADSGRAQHVKIEFRAASSASFHTVRTLTIADPHCYFDTPVTFDGSGSVRLAWAYPHGPTIHSRVVTITLQ
jgi:hypothetical protein